MNDASAGLPDQPISTRDKEALGLGDYADALTEFVQGCNTPMTIALQGDWGSGKTSLMNLIEEGLKATGDFGDEGKEGKSKTVWFNTWQYSQFNMESTLALTMMAKFADAMGHAPSSVLKTLRRGLWTVSKSVAIGAASLVAQGDTMKEIVGQLEHGTGISETNPAVSLERIKDGLREVVKERTHRSDPEKDGRIVVFIDDLDRLMPKRAVDLLEMLKMFFDIENCVYIIACDYSVVSAGLAEKFDIAEGQLAGRSFFDKIIQVPVKIPTRRYKAENYIERLLKEMNIRFHPEKGPELYFRLLEKSIGFNPRTMKRLLNSTHLLTTIYYKQHPDKQHPDPEIDSDRGEPQRYPSRVIFATLCMIEKYEAIYVYLSQGLTASRIEALRDHLDSGEEFVGLRQQIQQVVQVEWQERTATRRRRRIVKDVRDEQAAVVGSAVEFMHAFVDCVQIDNDPNIDDGEIEFLKEMMSLSSMVAVGEDALPLKMGKEFALEVVGELNRRYASSLPPTQRFHRDEDTDTVVQLDIGATSRYRTDTVLYVVEVEECYTFGVRCEDGDVEQFERFCELLRDRLDVDVEAARKLGSKTYEIRRVMAGPGALASFMNELFGYLDKIIKTDEDVYALWTKADPES